ncbi:MAG TPA: hypothetical protein VFS37_08300 [Conexibacter sp.]|nr:hypothetical protein [Conexibacter sp.]
MDDAAGALALIRLHELVRLEREVMERLTQDLEDYAPDAVCAGGEVEASIERQRSIVSDVEELLEVAELAHMLREALAQRDFQSLDVGVDAVEDAAAGWLRSGIADARQLRLAARLLPAREGLLALADALESVGEPWISDATLRDILGALRQFPAQLVDRIGDEAAVDVDIPLDEIDADAVRPLVAALRNGAEQLRTDEGRS